MSGPRRSIQRRRRAPAWASAVAVVALVALIAGACGQTVPSLTPSPTIATPAPTSSATGGPTVAPTPTQDPSAIYDTIQAQVSAIRGLTPPTGVDRVTIDEAELRRHVIELFNEDSPPEYIAGKERLYKALGLMPADQSLEDLSIDLLTGGVAGFYRIDEKRLYVVSRSGVLGANEKITFAHEFDHALQDEHFTVFADQDGITDQRDMILARQAVYEGDATLLMSHWAGSHFTTAEVLELLQAANDPAPRELLARMPPIMTETLLYPYTTGLAFVQGVHGAGGWGAVDALYGRMPVSTEQILHPDKYRSGELPIEVLLPAELAGRMGAGWSVGLEDSFGEFQFGVWLGDAGVEGAAAAAAAAGWGGDRLAVLNGPDGAWGVVLRTEWDSEADAIEFADAIQAVVNGLADPGRVSAPRGGTRVTILVGSDEATLLDLDLIFGATGV